MHRQKKLLKTDAIDSDERITSLRIIFITLKPKDIWKLVSKKQFSAILKCEKLHAVHARCPETTVYTNMAR